MASDPFAVTGAIFTCFKHSVKGGAFVQRIKIIGIEEHGWTAGVRDALNAFPADQQDPSIAFFNVVETDERLLDFGDRRLLEMDEMGMEMQILRVITAAT